VSASVPQPWQVWEPSPVTREEHMALAYEAEKAGKRLVAHTFANAYEPDGGGWIIEQTLVTDWRTGEVLVTYGMDDEDPDTSGWFNVEHRQVETD
jgi:hypothetical protein